MNENNKDKIKILIADDIPETRENLRKLLYFEQDLEIVGMASSGEEAVSLARELQPNIVLMDINMPGMDGITASETIIREARGGQVIMMSVQGEADYLRRSMLAGAREFLIKPFSSEELVSSIRRVHALTPPLPVAPPPPEPGAEAHKVKSSQRSPSLGHVISVFGPKGGVGTSTITANLAIALHEAAKDKVVLVDGNLQFGGLDVLLNLQASRTVADLATKMDDLDADLISSVLVPHPSGVKVLLAPPRPEMADMVHPEHMKAILEQMRRMFRYVVVDTWTSIQDLTLNILDVADQILLLATPEVPALKNAKVFFDVADALDYPPEKIWLVVNQADRRGAIRAMDIESSIKHPIAAAIPSDERVVFVAANQGVPLVVSHRGSPVAQAITALADRIHSNFATAEQPAPTEKEGAGSGHTGLLTRLFG
ncbi:MAG: MinD/ParA family protein [Chloroflexi bacterium]|nr:MinD/ParA family protein [Chloroflexota bacterium]